MTQIFADELFNLRSSAQSADGLCFVGVHLWLELACEPGDTGR
jgi:hypothetical protein